MLFVVINGVFVFLFLNLPFASSFLSLFTFWENKHQNTYEKL